MEWNYTSDSLPPKDRFVLVKRVTGYISTRIEIITAKYDPEYYSSTPWRDPSNTALTESGEEPYAWTECPDLEQKG